MLMDVGLDTGDMLLKDEVAITENMTCGELHDILSVRGADLLLRTIDGIVNKTIIPEKQKEETFYAKMLDKNLAHISWNKTAQEIHNLVSCLLYTSVNPNILGETGMDKGAIVTATCLAAAFASILMGLYANLPFVLASGMGLNAYFAYSVVIGQGISWEIALTAVFVEGIIFILLSLFKVREAVVNAIPVNMKYAVTAGIGLFIAFIGLTGSGDVYKRQLKKQQKMYQNHT